MPLNPGSIDSVSSDIYDANCPDVLILAVSAIGFLFSHTYFLALPVGINRYMRANGAKKREYDND